MNEKIRWPSRIWIEDFLFLLDGHFIKWIHESDGD